MIAATSYSLFVVGCTSLIGAANNWKNYDRKNFSIPVIFCLVSASVVGLIRRYVIPQIPEGNINFSGVSLQYATIATILFALLMIMASVPLIKNIQYNYIGEATKKQPGYKIFLCAFFVGIVTGLLGAGGGFLIVPALVFILRLDMKEAITTSLIIIAINSMVGFAFDFNTIKINWHLLGVVTIAAIAGVLIGRLIAKKTSSMQLKIVFGWLILLTGTVILLKEIIQNVIK